MEPALNHGPLGINRICHLCPCSLPTSQSLFALGISCWKNFTFSLTLFSFDMPVMGLSWSGAVFQKTCLTLCRSNQLCWFNSTGSTCGTVITRSSISHSWLRSAACFDHFSSSCTASLSGLRSWGYSLLAWGMVNLALPLQSQYRIVWMQSSISHVAMSWCHKTFAGL